MKYCISLLALALVCGQAQAQESPNWLHRQWQQCQAQHALRVEARHARRDGQLRFLTNETGFSINRSQDLHQANTTFTGIGAMVGRGFFAQGGKATRICRITAGYNYLSGAQTITHSPRVEVGYAYLRNVGNFGSHQKWNIRAGGSVQYLFNMRSNSALDNSAISLETGAQLAAEMRISRDFSFRKKPFYTFDYRLGVPLGAYLWRLPSYSLPGFETLSGSFRPIGNFTRITSEMGFSRPLSRKGNNRVRVAYTWDLYHIASELRPITVSNSYISVAWWLRL